MGTHTITYAGHSAALIEIGGIVVAVDPWLEGNPSTPKSLKTPKKIDLIVLTHGHSDHASEASKYAKTLGSHIAATWELANIMGSEGVAAEKLIHMNKGGTVQFNEIRVSLTNAFHSSSYDTSKGAVYAGEPCGVVLSHGDFSIYHSGDTALFSDMSLIRDIYKPDVAMLCIGDRFTMGPKEGAYAAKLLGVRRAIPIHYATFPLLTGTAEEFAGECSRYDIEAVVLKPGESLTF